MIGTGCRRLEDAGDPANGEVAFHDTRALGPAAARVSIRRETVGTEAASGANTSGPARSRRRALSLLLATYGALGGLPDFPARAHQGMGESRPGGREDRAPGRRGQRGEASRPPRAAPGRTRGCASCSCPPGSRAARNTRASSRVRPSGRRSSSLRTATCSGPYWPSELRGVQGAVRPAGHSRAEVPALGAASLRLQGPPRRGGALLLQGGGAAAPQDEYRPARRQGHGHLYVHAGRGRLRRPDDPDPRPRTARGEAAVQASGRGRGTRPGRSQRPPDRPWRPSSGSGRR